MEAASLHKYMDKKSPFIGYSVDEVNTMEGNYFCLVMGGDFIIQDKFYLFTKAEAKKVYRKMLKDLIKIAEDGNAKDSKYALDLIGGLAIKPMRLH